MCFKLSECVTKLAGNEAANNETFIFILMA